MRLNGLQDFYPKRIVCLTEEPTEVLYALGQEDRIVGVSGFTVRPARARKEKPKISAFLSAKIDEILDLSPDLVVGFSDIQASIAHSLIASGVEVWISNHRTVDGIISYILRLGGLVGAHRQAEAYVTVLRKKIFDVQSASLLLPRRPRVYFEEWDSPQISAIRWVSELVSIAGGDDIFENVANGSLAKNRIIEDPRAVINLSPDIIIGSWCGKKFKARDVALRPGWDTVPAVKDNHIYEIKSPIILQPGPAALTDGLDAIHSIVVDWVRATA